MILPLLLCSDLDRTLLPNGAEPESPHARPLFARLAAHSAVTLVYVSGRDRTLIEEAIRNYRLPRPDFAIGDVGSTIFDLRDGSWQNWARWEEEIAPDWGDCDREHLARLLADIDLLRPQEHTRQNRFKLSYYVPLDADPETLDPLIEARLASRGVATSRIWSVDEPAGRGLLDLLPRRANKLHAIEFLQAELGIAREQTLFAGDSGNDLEVLASAIPSVLVANAVPSVAREAIALASAAGLGERLHLARGGLLGLNGNYAGGILEGVAHFRPDLLPLLEAFAATG
jgi:sucrose-6F-phosphate phosphohydrolase